MAIQTYRLSANKGGLTGETSVNSSPDMMEIAENIDIHEGNRVKRKGSAIIGFLTGVVVAGIGKGLYAYWKRDGNRWLVIGRSVHGTKAYIIDNNGNITGHMTIVTSNESNSFETFNNVLFGNSGTTRPWYWSGASGGFEFWPSTSPPADNQYFGYGYIAGNVDLGWHNWMISFVENGIETYRHIDGAYEIHGFTGSVTITSLPTGNSNVTARKIYRSVSGTTSPLKYVGIINDNTTTTFTDNISDVNLGADFVTSDNTISKHRDWNRVGNYPKQFINHGRGVNQRLWACGTAKNPQLIYAAKESSADFYEATIVNILTTSEGGIVGMAVFGDRLFCFGKNNTYIIDDSNSDPSIIGYQEAQWSGGVAHFRLIVNTPNDLILMNESGEIYSIATAQQYGDYKAAILTRPAKMDKWIRENVDMTKIDKFHAMYYPTLRVVYFFMVASGSTSCDICLSYFLDRSPKEAWTIKKEHSFEADAATSVQVVPGDVRTYTIAGGRIWHLDIDSFGDDNNPYTARFKTVDVDCGSPHIEKVFKRGRLIVNPKGSESISVQTSVDGVAVGGVQVLKVGRSVDHLVSVDNAGMWYGGGIGFSVDHYAIGNTSIQYLKNIHFETGIPMTVYFDVKDGSSSGVSGKLYSMEEGVSNEEDTFTSTASWTTESAIFTPDENTTGFGISGNGIQIKNIHLDYTSPEQAPKEYYFDIYKKGKRISIEVSNGIVGEEMEIAGIDIDYTTVSLDVGQG